MRNLIGLTVVLAAAAAASAGEPAFGHMVFFKLKDASAAKKQELVTACRKYLDKHPGTLHFSAGVRAEEADREVNAKDWDVALHIVFADKAAHDKYQKAPRHLQFIKENKDNWQSVRVFDSRLAGGK